MNKKKMVNIVVDSIGIIIFDSQSNIIMKKTRDELKDVERATIKKIFNNQIEL